MTRTRALLGALAALLLTMPLAPANAATDQRVRIVRYVPDQVVRLDATLGFVVTLFFGEDERIENVAVGDSLGWQITPNRRARVLFIKPNERAAATNMTVVTTLRSYNFDLRAVAVSRARQPLFSLRFDYPAPAQAVIATPSIAPPPPAPPQEVNKAYSFSGSSQGLPERVFDDGVSTYFVFPAGVDYPAIFAVDPDNKEAVVNIAQRDGFVIADRLASAFVLRRGEQVTRIINDGYREAATATSLSARKSR